VQELSQVLQVASSKCSVDEQIVYIDDDVLNVAQDYLH
jgi:hypothetical protein